VILFRYVRAAAEQMTVNQHQLEKLVEDKTRDLQLAKETAEKTQHFLSLMLLIRASVFLRINWNWFSKNLSKAQTPGSMSEGLVWGLLLLVKLSICMKAGSGWIVRQSDRIRDRPSVLTFP
jgi:hypothetical protein